MDNVEDLVGEFARIYIASVRVICNKRNVEGTDVRDKW